jgi:hypothetical protein
MRCTLRVFAPSGVRAVRTMRGLPLLRRLDGLCLRTVAVCHGSHCAVLDGRVDLSPDLSLHS